VKLCFRGWHPRLLIRASCMFQESPGRPAPLPCCCYCCFPRKVLLSSHLSRLLGPDWHRESNMFHVRDISSATDPGQTIKSIVSIVFVFATLKRNQRTWSTEVNCHHHTKRQAVDQRSQFVYGRVPTSGPGGSAVEGWPRSRSCGIVVTK